MERVKQDWTKLKVWPLEERKSLTRLEDVLRDPDGPLPECNEGVVKQARQCADRMVEARRRGAGVILMYGAHLLRNGAAPLLARWMERGVVTHLATNGAATIHDWEYAWLGRSTESVRENVATGTFGAWEETGRALMTALLAGGLKGEGYGKALGRFIEEDGAELPAMDELAAAIAAAPAHELTAARADALRAMAAGLVAPGRLQVGHSNKDHSIVGRAFRRGVPMTVHPGIGYDIIVNHPLYDGGVVGRAAGADFRTFSDSVETLDGGVVVSVGSAIMAPQVFEKSLSAVNNLRIQAGRAPVAGHTIFVVDLQDGGNWDWTQGEPPKTNAAYYLRFCKSFSRMGAAMHYAQSDNMAFLLQVEAALKSY